MEVLLQLAMAMEFPNLRVSQPSPPTTTISLLSSKPFPSLPPLYNLSDVILEYINIPVYTDT